MYKQINLGSETEVGMIIMKHKVYLFLGVLGVICLIGCQPTPNHQSFVGKNNAGQNSYEDSHQIIPDGEKAWQKSFDLGRNIQLNIDAPLPSFVPNSQIASIPITPAKFGDMDIKGFFEALFPTGEFYLHGEGWSRDEINALILRCRKLIFEEQSSDDQNVADNIAFWNEEIKKLESMYPSAPETSLLPPKYEFSVDSSGKHLSIIAKVDDITYGLDIRDNTVEKYSWLYLTSDKRYLNDSCVMAKNRMNEEKASYAIHLAQEILEKIKMEDFIFNTVLEKECYDISGQKAEANGYSVIFTKSVQGYSEQYVDHHMGTLGTETYSPIWKSEYLRVDLWNDELVKMDWSNPSETHADQASSGKILPWTEIQEHALNAMQTKIKGDPFASNTTYTINEIHFGYTKIIRKNTDTYQLVPTWNFYGQKEYLNDNNEAVQESHLCILVLNAYDGSQIDMGLGY